MDCTVLNLGHARTIHRWGNEDISSPFMRVYYVRAGRALLHLPSGDQWATSGHMYLIPAYEPHAYECDPGFEFYYLFMIPNSREPHDIFNAYDFPYEVKTNTATQLLFENFCHLYPQLNLPTSTAVAFDHHQGYQEYAEAFNQMEDYERLQLQGMVDIIISYFLKHARPVGEMRDEKVALMIDFIHSNYQRQLTIEEVADHACVTSSYAIRRFRKLMGITPMQYVIRHKIRQAQNLLVGSRMSVSEVSQALGFQDASYFIRLFRKHIGYTPQEYREHLIG